MSERLKFVERYRSGESMSALCREFGVSRKSGYKFVERFEQWGEAGLLDSSRRPKHVATRTPEALVERIVALRREHSAYGPRKLRSMLMGESPGVRWPCQATFANILKRKQLSRPQRRRRGIRPYGKELAKAEASNDVWCIDYKGQFKLGCGRYCYPLTVTDQFSRYVLVCDGFESICGEDVQRSLLMAFGKYGLPRTIRSDNGAPFGSPRSTVGWSRFSAWLAQIGIEHERIEPGHPEQNGRHERMHRTLKAETTRPAEKTLLAQQVRFDAFCDTFNNKRPHEALGDVTPATVYESSPRRLPKELAPLRYPLHDLERRVLRGGIVYLRARHRFALSDSLEGQVVGLRELEGARWLVTFASHDLGFYDEATKRFELDVENTSTRKETSEKRKVKKRT